MLIFNKSNDAIKDAGDGIVVLNFSDIPLRSWVFEYKGLKFALNVNQFGIEPSVAVRDGILFIGVEQAIFVVSANNGFVVNSISDIANIQWLEDDVDSCVIYVAEDELIVLNSHGDISWRKNLPDIIQNTDLVPECLHVSDVSGRVFTFNITDGAIVSSS
jgi:hypothetical protein